MGWLRMGMATATAAGLVATLPVSASALHRTPAVGQPPGYFTSVNSGLTNPANGQGTASASCPNAVVWGGGIANHGDSPFGVSVSISTPTGSSGWIGRANNPTPLDGAFDVYAICADKPAGYKIVKKAVNAPAGTRSTVTATCPAGKVILGGGADSATNSPLSLITSAAPAGSTSFAGYLSNGSAAAAKLQVFAVCAKQPPGYVIKTKALTSAAGETSATVSCAKNTSTLGGGAALAKHTPNVFVIASAPNGSAGWTAVVANGTAGKVKGTVYAICGR